MQNQRLGSEEFTETLLELTSVNILSDFYIGKYQDFCNNLFFSLWKQYYYSEQELPVKHYSDLLEIFFINLFTYPSSSERDNEVLLP